MTQRAHTRTNSSIERIESVVSAVLDGPPAPLSAPQVRRLAKAARNLLSENHRLTLNNARLQQLLREQLQLRTKQLKELSALQMALRKQGLGVSVRPAGDLLVELLRKEAEQRPMSEEQLLEAGQGQAPYTGL